MNFNKYVLVMFAFAGIMTVMMGTIGTSHAQENQTSATTPSTDNQTSAIAPSTGNQTSTDTNSTTTAATSQNTSSPSSASSDNGASASTSNATPTNKTGAGGMLDKILGMLHLGGNK